MLLFTLDALGEFELFALFFSLLFFFFFFFFGMSGF
jgi:hypothetical protein